MMRLTHTLTRPDRPEEIVRLYVDGTPRNGDVRCIIRYLDRDTGEPVEHRYPPGLISAEAENENRASGNEKLGWNVTRENDR